MWVKLSERKPPKYGNYHVIRMNGGKAYEDEMLWNGRNFVTAKGSLSRGVKEWWDDAVAPEDAGEHDGVGRENA